MDRPRVLLALAEPTLSAALATALEAAGFEVAQRGAAPPDFALLEVPLADAGQAGALRAAGTAFAVVAAREDAAEVQHAIRAGALGCFVKPLEPAVIVSSIGAWLERAGARGSAALQLLHEGRAIATAVGVLMERHGLPPQRAFDALRRQARDQRTSVLGLSRDIVDGRATLRQLPD
jgi:AmiR/NasT family two-component response regulator